MAYQPEELPADFAEALGGVRDRLGPLGSPILYFSSAGSTNDVAAKLAAAGHQEGAVVIADAQTAGRGRRGRGWFSPPRAGLYVSVVVNPAGAPFARRERAGALLTLAAGVALAEAVQRATGLALDIKWPNDLVAGGRKVAGILAEAVIDQTQAGASVVLGYGINVAPSAFPAELRDRATSLEGELGRPVDRAALCAETLAGVAARYGDLLEGRFDAILDRWRGLAPGSRGARVAWDTPAGPQSGVTAGIDEWGALLVQLDSRIERLVAGEVTWA